MGGLDPRRTVESWMARIRWRYAPEAGHGELINSATYRAIWGAAKIFAAPFLLRSINVA
jgi:hypothetical protein